MKVKCYPSDATGSGQYRLQFPAAAAAAIGCDVTCSSGKDGDGIPIERSMRDNIQYIRPQPTDADVFVLQRPADENVLALIPSIQRAGIAVVVEVDDDLSCLPTTHPAHRILHPKLSPRANWRNVEQACRIADLVTVSTPALAERYGKHGRVMVLENCIPERLLQMPRLSDGNTVGWSGFTPTHPGDLRATGGGVAEAVRKGARYLQVGPATGVKEQLCLDGYPEATGALPNIEDYYMALGRLDVGICPLLDTAFNHAKSWLKPLEMAARGVVPVMSPVREYAGIHEEGIGRLAGRGRDWRAKITDLLENDDVRQTYIGVGYEVARRWTIEGNAEYWIAAWEQALKNRHAAGLEVAA